MNARKMKRRIYQRHAHTLRTRKYARCLMTGNMEPILRPIVRAMVKRLIRPFLRTLEASAKTGKSISVFTGAVGGVSSPNWANQGLGLPPYHPSLNDGKPEQAA